MSTKVSVTIERQVTQFGYCSFSTEHETDIVEKWLVQNESSEWENEIDNWEDSYTDKTWLDSTDYQECEGDDDCEFDDEIQEWKNEHSVSLNVFFKSGCDVDLISKFIHDNKESFNSITNKDWVEELTEDEKDVFSKLQQIVKLNSKSTK